MIVSGLLFDFAFGLFVVQLIVLVAQLRSWRRLVRARRAAERATARYNDMAGYRNVRVR